MRDGPVRELIIPIVYYARVVYRPAMEALFAERALAILEGIALLGVGVAIILSSAARSGSQRPRSRMAQVFWRDVSQAGFIWATGTLALLVGSIVGIDGMRAPIWLLLAIIVGTVSLALVLLRWRRLRPAQRSPADDPSPPDQSRVVSTTWEVGVLGSGAGALLVYMASLSHSWGHPIHWLVAGLGALFGYAVGLIAGTPRYTLKRGSNASISP